MGYQPGGIEESPKRVVKDLPIMIERFSQGKVYSAQQSVLIIFPVVPILSMFSRFLCSKKSNSTTPLHKTRTHSWAATAFAIWRP